MKFNFRSVSPRNEINQSVAIEVKQLTKLMNGPFTAQEFGDRFYATLVSWAGPSLDPKDDEVYTNEKPSSRSTKKDRREWAQKYLMALTSKTDRVLTMVGHRFSFGASSPATN